VHAGRLLDVEISLPTKLLSLLSASAAKEQLQHVNNFWLTLPLPHFFLHTYMSRRMGALFLPSYFTPAR
jgi:hypothetical protein